MMKIMMIMRTTKMNSSIDNIYFLSYIHDLAL
jgi:hypothetical protein